MATTFGSGISRGAASADQSLAEAVYAAILERIIRGNLKPGTVLSAVKWAEKLAVSRTPVHEALRMLEADGLVVNPAGRRAQVAEFTRDDLWEIFEMRALLESRAAELAAGRMDERQLGPLRSLADSLSAREESEEWITHWAEFDERFHGDIAAACGNRRLAQDIRRYRLIHRGFNHVRSRLRLAAAGARGTHRDPRRPLRPRPECRTGCDAAPHRKLAALFCRALSLGNMIRFAYLSLATVFSGSAMAVPLPDLEGYRETVLPVLETYCLDCHDRETQKGKLSLEGIDADIIGGEQLEIWRLVRDQLHFQDMPPAKKSQPSAVERAAVLAWLRGEFLKSQQPDAVTVEKLALPQFGNYVDHHALFDQRRARVEPAPPRVWRLRPDIYDSVVPRLGEGVGGLANALGYADGRGSKISLANTLSTRPRPRRY